MKIYVDNLAPETTRVELLKAFKAHGEVSSVSLLRTRMRGRHGSGSPHGIGLVTMPDRTQAQAALAALNLHEIGGRAVTVQAARPNRSRRLRR